LPEAFAPLPGNNQETVIIVINRANNKPIFLMRKVLLVILLLISSKAFTQSTNAILKTSDQLVSQKKYKTAFDVLNKADPKNRNPDIVIAKEDIVLAYFVTSIMHKMFSLMDLKSNEDIMDYRGKAGSSQLYVLPVDSVLNELIKTDHDNYKLYKALGNYYYEVFLHYNAHWTETPETLFKRIEDNYAKVIELQKADYMVYYELGYINEVQEKYGPAANYFLKSIELNSHCANAYYNLAYAELYQNNRSEALKNAIKSIDLYEDKTYKADAARMTGEIYSELNDTKNELYYYELSNSIDPKNYYTLKSLLDVYVKTQSPKEKNALNTFYSLGPENPTIYNDLSKIYFNKPKELSEFYESKLPGYIDHKKVYGSLNFYLAQLYLSTDKVKAKECLLKAKITLATVLPQDNPVFSAIETLLKQASN